MNQIVEYIKRKYSPLSIILYGSYANGTNDPNSDFDALVISQDHEKFHDTSVVDGIQLDVFVYPESYFDGGYDCGNFVQIFDGNIIMDTGEKGKGIQNDVLSYLKTRSRKTREEIQADVDWCVKMQNRAKRGDVEGMFRWHWILIDSLEIFCDVVGHPYFGPKKTLKWMEENDPASFACYGKALRDFRMESLFDWVSHLERKFRESLQDGAGK